MQQGLIALRWHSMIDSFDLKGTHVFGFMNGSWVSLRNSLFIVGESLSFTAALSIVPRPRVWPDFKSDGQSVNLADSPSAARKAADTSGGTPASQQRLARLLCPRLSS